MRDTAVFFSGAYIERNTLLRHDPAAVAAAWAAPDTRFLPVWQAQPLIRDGAAARLTRAELGARLPEQAAAIYLGVESGRHLFAVALEDRDAPPGPGEFGGLRDLVSRVSAADAGLLAYARAMVTWHRHHRHCGVCGAPTRAEDAGFVLVCSSTNCGHRSFPRLDPAIIVLVHHDQHCLLGRQPTWPSDRFSTLAGFAEPGEALEDAVRREVREETDVAITHCRYRASQPWPFPASLMIGFHAMATHREIRLNDGELAEARWFTREELGSGTIVLPPRASVAYRLIEDWFDSVPGPGLATLHRDGEFLRRPEQPPDAR
ncbi:MAG: NAD(+) diphosphatase [Gammaproteobacteria bacterium]|nr:NAD(+) diphosphatase [Gammaproteobacteria bacterium]